MSVKLTFLGAADTVTGSRTLVQYKGKQWLVDCGQFQGAKELRERNWTKFTPDPSKIDKIILTHAHLDHSGYLPKICAEGFDGPILATQGTMDLCGVILRDAAWLEEESAKYANESGYSNHKPALPLFTTEDAEKALSQFKAITRHEWFEIDEGVSIRFIRAGHIIGASLVQFSFDHGLNNKILTFTGDLGNGRSFLLRSPEQIQETDTLIMESTYGGRMQPRTSPLDALAEIVNRTYQKQGVLVIPAFAVGRAQELIYMLRLLEDRDKIPKMPVILDSPMATTAMEICVQHQEDQVLNSAFHGTSEPFLPHLFEISVTPNDSMLACMKDGPMIVISASGMLTGGRILHHLKHRLPRENNTVLFTGYQAEGSKGHFVQAQAAKEGTVRIHHEEVPVLANIETIDHLSAHADQEDLLAYIEKMRKLPKQIFINHGNPVAQQDLALRIEQRFGIKAVPVATKNHFEIFLT